MNTQNGDLDTVVQEALKNDAEFQTTLASLSTDEEKAKATEAKKKEILAAKAPEFFQISRDQKIRAEKAEQELKEGKGNGDKKDDDVPPTQALSTADLYALMNAKVEQEDVEEVQKAAKLMNKSIAEVLQEPTVIGIIKERVEKRNSARAAEKDKNNGGGGQGPTESDILERSRKGERFEPGSREAEILYRAKRNIK
jgi:hypothetical protein